MDERKAEAASSANKVTTATAQAGWTRPTPPVRALPMGNREPPASRSLPGVPRDDWVAAATTMAS
ncbi:hypothetical protein GCM10009638_23550 [Luteococcus sanguinis]